MFLPLSSSWTNEDNDDDRARFHSFSVMRSAEVYIQILYVHTRLMEF